MPTLPVDAAGTILYYEDSGPPPGSQVYHTIILVHGLMYHGGTFRPMLQHASRHNLRLVAVNRRDYPGSSPFSAPELDSLANVGTRASAVLALGYQLATFVCGFIQEAGISPTKLQDGKRVGGVSIVFWSLGNIVNFSFLGNARSFDEGTTGYLEKYLRTVVVYDAPAITMGRPCAEDVYVPFKDTTLDPEDLPERFVTWVSTFYTPITDLDAVTQAQLAKRGRLPNDYPNRDTRSTYLSMSPKTRLDVIDPGVSLRSMWPMLMVHSDVYARNFESALFDTRGVWQDVDILALWCDQGTADCVYGAQIISEALCDSQGSHSRKIRLVKLDNANHLLHWEEPERMVRVLLEMLD